MRNSVCSTVALLFCVGAVIVFTNHAIGQEQRYPADMIVVNGSVYTVNPEQPWAQALAIRAGKIVAVGPDETIQAYRGPLTRVINAKDHIVLPGFTDSHVHFMGGSLRLTQVRLEAATNVAEIQRSIKEYASTHPKTPWILGGGWKYSAFGRAAVPDKKYLDEVVPDRPAFLLAYDHHSSWVNSKALELAGINRETPDPPNGTIVRDPKTGEATGMLKEFPASALIERVIPEPTHVERLEALRDGLHEANRFGVVHVDSAAGDTPYLPLFDELRKRGELSVRFSVATLMNPPEVTQGQIGLAEQVRRKYHDEWIDASAIKFIGDGVIEAHTAALLEPYTDDPATSGHLNWSPEKYKEGVRELDQRGFQIFTHAIGSRAIRLALDAYEAAQQANGTKDGRWRVEHIEDPAASDIPRFGRLNVIASMQPLHASPDNNNLNVWARNVGAERATRSWPWNSIIETGGLVAFGSDWSVVTINPWPGVQLLLTRETPEGTPPGGWNPEQRLTVEQAIYGYTMAGAIASRREKTEGSLQAGKVADLIIVSQDPFHTDATEIGKTEILVTVVGGKVVYQSPSWSAAGSHAK
ncbi:MAG TPA: amidohydrolase [Terriglobales bacterium]|nr:amidohydrolase [Terriglobales bacterium]